MEQTLVLCRHRWNNYSDNNVPRCSTRKWIPSQSFRYSNRTLSICFHNSMRYHNCERQNNIKVVQEKYLTHNICSPFIAFSLFYCLFLFIFYCLFLFIFHCLFLFSFIILILFLSSCNVNCLIRYCNSIT